MRNDDFHKIMMEDFNKYAVVELDSNKFTILFQC